MMRSLIGGVWSLQFLRFAAVGFLNLVIDFVVLNLLSYATDIYAGPRIAALNAVAFSVAVLNSYAWNKYWTFRRGGTVGTAEFSKFFIVNICGAALNSGIVFAITTYIAPVGGLHPQAWLNVAKVAALPFSTFWNFFGTKHFIFGPVRAAGAPAEQR